MNAELLNRGLSAQRRSALVWGIALLILTASVLVQRTQRRPTNERLKAPKPCGGEHQPALLARRHGQEHPQAVADSG